MPLTRSRPENIGRGYLGKFPPEVWLVVERAWESGISVSSDFARQHASIIALASSLGWISSVSLSGKRYTRRWNITTEGTIAYNHIRGQQVPCHGNL